MNLSNHIIEKTFKKLNRVSNLNRGGCLYACYAVYLKLKQKNIDVSNLSIIELWHHTLYIDNNKEFIKWKNNYASSDSHFALTIDGWINVFDSDGEVDVWHYDHNYIIESKHISKFCRNALKYWWWNDDFNRKRGVKQINKLLGVKMPIIIQ